MQRRAFATKSTSIFYTSIVEHSGKDHFEAELVMTKKPKPTNPFRYGESPSDDSGSECGYDF